MGWMESSQGGGGPELKARSHFQIEQFGGHKWRIRSEAGLGNNDCVKHDAYVYLTIDVSPHFMQVDMDKQALAACDENRNGVDHCHGPMLHLEVDNEGELQYDGRVNFRSVPNHMNDVKTLDMGDDGIIVQDQHKPIFKFAVRRHPRIGSAKAPEAIPWDEVECERHPKGGTQAEHDAYCHNDGTHPCWWGFDHTCTSKKGDGCTCW